MKKHIMLIFLGTGLLAAMGCKGPDLAVRPENRQVPASYDGSSDTINAASISWKAYFGDSYLIALIDTALARNQELQIHLQEIEIKRNEIREKKGEYLPFVGLRAGAGMDKKARYTNIGAMEATTDIRPGHEMPEPLPDFVLGAYASWEVDIWKKLRNARKGAVMRYLSSVEGRHLLMTDLIAEIAASYYELLALDNQQEIVRKNIEIQQGALRVMRIQLDNGGTTALAVRRFEAEVLHTQSLLADIQQRLTETENRINLLMGRYPQPIPRSAGMLDGRTLTIVPPGLPTQLLANRPDVRQAEYELAAAKLDVAVARARFYPTLELSAAVGYQAFNPAYLFKTPESLLYTLVGELTAPLINRNAIKAAYASATARQLQAVYGYEQTLLNAYVEVANQLAKLNNLEQACQLRARQVDALTESIEMSNSLFRAARADYLEVLLTQREALESRFELVELRAQQLIAKVQLYRALGGGWHD